MSKETKNKVYGDVKEIYTRVVGYYRPVANFSEGKKREFNDRGHGFRLYQFK